MKASLKLLCVVGISISTRVVAADVARLIALDTGLRALSGIYSEKPSKEELTCDDVKRTFAMYRDHLNYLAEKVKLTDNRKQLLSMLEDELGEFKIQEAGAKTKLQGKITRLRELTEEFSTVYCYAEQLLSEIVFKNAGENTYNYPETLSKKYFDNKGKLAAAQKAILLEALQQLWTQARQLKRLADEKMATVEGHLKKMPSKPSQPTGVGKEIPAHIRPILENVWTAVNKISIDPAKGPRDRQAAFADYLKTNVNPKDKAQVRALWPDFLEKKPLGLSPSRAMPSSKRELPDASKDKAFFDCIQKLYGSPIPGATQSEILARRDFEKWYRQLSDDEIAQCKEEAIAKFGSGSKQPWKPTGSGGKAKAKRELPEDATQLECLWNAWQTSIGTNFETEQLRAEAYASFKASSGMAQVGLRIWYARLPEEEFKKVNAACGMSS